MMASRLKKAEASEYTIQGLFDHGYRNKEDVSNLPANTLIIGSQNVLTNASEYVGIRQGYVLDGGAGNQDNYGIDSSYDFNTGSSAGIQNVRKWGSNLEMRYLNPNTKLVSWINIMSTLIATNKARFATWYDITTEQKSLCLFVNGDNQIYEWTGGSASVASFTSNTITIQQSNLGTQNFYQNSNNVSKFQFIAGGVVYTYTGAGYLPVNSYSVSSTAAQQEVGFDYISQLFTTTSAAQRIYSATANYVNNFGVNLFNVTAYGYIYTDNAGVPGTVLATTVSTVSEVLTAGNFSMSFSFNNLLISPSTNYHFVTHLTNPSGDMGVYTANSTGQGTNKSNDGAVTWSAVNGGMSLVVVENDAAPNQFSGVSPTPSGLNVGDSIIQIPAVGAASNSGNPSLPFPYEYDLISSLSGHVWYGSFLSPVVYGSRTTNPYDVTAVNAMLPTEADGFILSSMKFPPTGFVPFVYGNVVTGEQDSMYISSGVNDWWASQKLQQQSTLSSSEVVATTTVYLTQLKTTNGQASQSQELIGMLKNQILFISNEPIFNSFGPVQDILGSAQIVNMSDPIRNDMNAYNFANGQTYYDNYYIYITIPEEGVVRMYNCQKEYWEAPQILPVSRFYKVQGQATTIYAHSFLTNESYQMFTGYNDNGQPINAVAAFPYVSQEGGESFQKKAFNKIYVEGYITPNTVLTNTINYEFGGWLSTTNQIIKGNDTKILRGTILDGSIGQNPLGQEPIGSILNLPSISTIPKFRVIKTFLMQYCFENQIVFSSNDVDQQWAILRFGFGISAADDQPNEITE